MEGASNYLLPKSHGVQQCQLLSWPDGNVHPETGMLLIPNVLGLALIPLPSLPLVPKLPLLFSTMACQESEYLDDQKKCVPCRKCMPGQELSKVN